MYLVTVEQDREKGILPHQCLNLGVAIKVFTNEVRKESGADYYTNVESFDTKVVATITCIIGQDDSVITLYLEERWG